MLAARPPGVTHHVWITRVIHSQWYATRSACTVHGVHPALRAALDADDGLAIRAALPDVPSWAWSNAVRSRRLIRIMPGVYALPESVDSDLRMRGALAYGRGKAALSHVSALALFGLRTQPDGEPIHLTVADSVRLRSAHLLVVHHRAGFEPEATRRRGCEVTPLACALVESWPLLGAAERTGLIIDAVNGRMLLPEHLAGALAHAPKIAGAGALKQLTSRLLDGCRSPLELWGADHVFVGPGMPEFVRQAPLCLDDTTYYLDVFAERERVDFELDGAAWHGSTTQRERDLRRDARLAATGVQVVRFSYARIMSEPERVRDEILRILSSRREFR